MYMDITLPLPINSNPGMVLPPRTFTTVHDVARFAARIIDGILEHKEMLDRFGFSIILIFVSRSLNVFDTFSGDLPLERAASREKNQPLCMAQYYRLLGSCRRAGIERDSQFLPDLRNLASSHHIVVCCRNQMYCVVVKSEQIGRLSEDEIFSQLLYILSDAPCLPKTPPMVGLLTAEPRRVWAKDRATLMLDEQNSRNIELIEQSLILLCLDETLPPSFNARGFIGATPSYHTTNDRDETNMAHEMIHGGGSYCNTSNRWFDKTMQIIVCNDGSWGLCYEHSTSEGIAVVQLLEKILNKIDEIPSPEENGITQHHLPPPERIEWIIRQEIQRRIQEATRDVNRLVVLEGFKVLLLISLFQTHRRPRLLRLPIQVIRQELHQVVQSKPRRVHPAGTSIGILQVIFRHNC